MAKAQMQAATGIRDRGIYRAQRQPVFHGLREDKLATDVKTERIAATPGRGNSPTDVGGVRITHPDRVIFPAAALTKGALAAYYAEAAERILPHLHDRPLSLLRC